MPYRMYFYRTARGEREVRTFLRDLPWKHRLKCVDYLNRVRQQGTRLPANIVKHIEGELWEARPEYGGIEYRFFFFVGADNRIGVVSAIVKKRQRVERSIIERALQRAAEMRHIWSGRRA
jgi:phage-related protein